MSKDDNYIEKVLRDKLDSIRTSIKSEREAIMRADAKLAELKDQEAQLVSFLDYSSYNPSAGRAAGPR